MASYVNDPQRLMGTIITRRQRAYSYSRIDHPALGLVGGWTFSRDPEAGTAVIRLGGVLLIEGREELFIPGKDEVGLPYLTQAEPAELDHGMVIEGEVQR